MLILKIFLLILFCGQIVTGHPVEQRVIRNIKWKIPTVSVNVTAFPRGLTPILILNNYTHTLPLKSIELSNGTSYNKVNIIKQPSVSGTEIGLEQQLRAYVTCSRCKAGMYFILSYTTRSKPDDNFQTFIDLCVNVNLFAVEVCDGIISRFAPQLKYIINNPNSRSNFDVNELCASIILNDDCLGKGKSANENWEVELPPTVKPQPKNLQLPKENVPTFKVLHITDTHYDPLYAEGASAVCKEAICCRNKSQTVLKESDGAGKWGDYRNCDPPKATIDNMFDHIIKDHPDIDYIIWTGDLQPHNVWSETKEENLELLREMVATMKERFPQTPIFPAVGNHESSPASSFPQPYITDPKFSNQWLLDELDILWRRWLPENVSATIKYGGFYSVLVRPGFRIISINTNYCYVANLWLLMDATDVASHLQWLVYELQAAELSNEKVHIIGHIPPGYGDCMRVWSKNYYNIIARYESTVTGQFFGHTHGDEFEVYYDPDDLSRAINVAYIAPSVTPYSNFNPGYKIYYVDGDHADTSRMVIDEEGWFFNLTDANIKGTPYWYKLYSARSSYRMDGLRPSDWNNFINRIQIDDETFDLYHKHYWRDSPKRPECDALCKKNFICDAKSGRSHDRKVLCETIQKSKYEQKSSGFFSRVSRLIDSAVKFVSG